MSRRSPAGEKAGSESAQGPQADSRKPASSGKSCQRTRFGNGRALTLEVTCLRIHMPRKTKQRDDADWTGEQNNGQHHTPRNKLLLVSLSDLHGN
jgi:hypothetical protein